MLIKLHCPNGHKLSVDDQHAGQKGVCPKCQSEVLVPNPRSHQISDSSIMAVLGEYVPSKSLVASPDARAMAPMRGCPKCHARISTVYRRCPHCQTYLTSVERNEVA
jgi:hypothetical protein